MCGWAEAAEGGWVVRRDCKTAHTHTHTLQLPSCFMSLEFCWHKAGYADLFCSLMDNLFPRKHTKMPPFCFFYFAADYTKRRAAAWGLQLGAFNYPRCVFIIVVKRSGSLLITVTDNPAYYGHFVQQQVDRGLLRRAHVSRAFPPASFLWLSRKAKLDVFDLFLPKCLFLLPFTKLSEGLLWFLHSKFVTFRESVIYTPPSSSMRTVGEGGGGKASLSPSPPTVGVKHWNLSDLIRERINVWMKWREKVLVV